MIDSLRAFGPSAGRRIGVMQGRLSPRPMPLIQAFPWIGWEREFHVASELGLGAIEWQLDPNDWEQNPLSSEAGRERIRSLSARTGVPTRSVCGDLFMVRRLSGVPDSERLEHVALLQRMLGHARDIGASRLLLPILEGAALTAPEHEDQLVDSLRRCLPAAERAGVTLGLEMEIAGPEYAALIRRVGHPKVGAYYDVGNSCAAGHDVVSDVVHVLPHLIAVHLKDRKRGGATEPFGQGDVPFAAFFDALNRHGWRGDFVLQHWFGADHVFDALRTLTFVQRELERAAREAA